MTSGNGKEAFESAAEIGVGKSYNNKQFAQIFKGIRASIEDAAAESGRDPIVDDGNTGALPPTEYPDPDYPALEPGDIWIDANGSLNFYYNGQWNQVKVYTKNVLPDDDSPLRIITPNDESFDNQEDYNEWLYTRTDRQPIHSDTPPLEHPDFPAYDLKDGDYWIDYNNHLYYWDYSKQAWVPIAGSNARTAIYSPIPPTLHPDYDPPDDALVPGDTWYDTDNQFKQYVYNGTDWILITNYVSKEGGDTMEGPLKVTGDRSANADGIESTVETLNVDSGQNSSLNLKHNGSTQIYVGSTQTSFQGDIKFNVAGRAIYTGSDKKGFVINDGGVFYDGAYSQDRHVATKKNVEEAIYHDILDTDTNKYVDRTGDSMSGPLVIDNTEVRFNNSSDGQTLIRASRNEAEFPMVLDLRNPGGSVEGGYDIKIQGNTSYNQLRFVGNDTYLTMNGGGGAQNRVMFNIDISLENNRIENLGSPVNDNDAATKKYVDDNAGGTLQAATSSVLGGVKIGSGVSVTNDGKISVSTNYASSSHTHSYASTSHNHNSDYVKGNYTITKSNGNYYIS